MTASTRHQGAERRIIVMQPGPLHLFWTTGVFYLWHLADRFDFVLIVPESYRNDARFGRLRTLPAVRHVECLDLAINFRGHCNYSLKIRELLERYRPAYLLMHNRAYVENQYLLHWVRRVCPDAIRYHYQNGRASLRWKEDFAARRATDIERVLRRWPILAPVPGVAGRLVDIFGAIAYFLNFKLFPGLTLQTVFHSPINVYTGAIDRKAVQYHCNGEKDYLFAYLDVEIALYRRQGVKNVAKVMHPLRQVAKEVLAFLEEGPKLSDTIFLVPSYGYTSRLMEAGWSPARVVSHLSARWCRAIEALLQKFPGHSIKIKLHPASSRDPIWQSILLAMQQELPALAVMSPADSAESQAAKSRVIVGDVSSILWWAGLYGGKVVISLDIFDFPGGDELAEYGELIHYVNNIQALPGWPKILPPDQVAPSIDAYFTA